MINMWTVAPSTGSICFFTNILRNYQTYSQFSNYKAGLDYAPILRYIQSHYDTVTLPRLSEIFHYSAPDLSKIIKENTGKNFKQLINELNYAKPSIIWKRQITPVKISQDWWDITVQIISTIYSVKCREFRPSNTGSSIWRICK